MNDLKNLTTPIPTRWVGPLQFASVTTLGKSQTIVPTQVPLATLETTLFFSVARGSKAIANAGGVQSTLISDSMTRSITLETKDASEASAIGQFVKTNLAKIQKEVVQTLSRYAQLQTIDVYQVANLVYLRIAIFSDNASGHNMVTLVADGIGDYVLKHFKTAQYVSVSGNMCVDKKVSVINGVRLCEYVACDLFGNWSRCCQYCGRFTRYYLRRSQRWAFIFFHDDPKYYRGYRW